jgi:hypothetical protein
VSVKETSVCLVDDTGRIVREVKVASEPEALLLDSSGQADKQPNEDYAVNRGGLLGGKSWNGSAGKHR